MAGVARSHADNAGKPLVFTLSSHALCLQIFKQGLLLEELKVDYDKITETNRRMEMEICAQVCRLFDFVGSG